jgi:hypothetical protein
MLKAVPLFGIYPPILVFYIDNQGVHFAFGANLAHKRPELNLRAERAKPNGLCSLSAMALASRIQGTTKNLPQN